MLNLEKKFVYFFLVISFILFILSFINIKSLNINKDKLKIITTNGAFYDFFKTIGGDKIEVKRLSFFSSGGHMHNVELLPQDVNQLNNADIIVKTGYGIDDWLDKYLSNSKGKIIEINKGVNLIKEDKYINPHYWLSIKNAKIIVKNINEILNQLDSKNSYYYNKKTRDYLLELDNLEKIAQESLKNISQKKVITTHPSFDYFLEEYNIQVMAKVYSDDLKDLSPNQILNLGKLIKKENIKVIFVEKGFLTILVKQIADIYNLKIFFLNPIEVISEKENYYNLMLENIQSIKEALQF